MNISLRWLNAYLHPSDLTAAAAESALTAAGFPIESIKPLDDGDTLLDVEVTSNRGDCLSHLGVAREIAAASAGKIAFKPPAIGLPADAPASSPELAAAVSLDNRVEGAAGCPMFTARIIRGIKVGPSPDWLVKALAAVGQRSINNVVDATNYVQFEYGQPTHVFDLASIAKSADGRAALTIREAQKGEQLKLLDGQTLKLGGGELIVCDGPDGEGGRPISLAGIMGGFDTQVSSATTDVLLEAATWEPLAVRRAARRHGLRTDASYRFERTVDPRTIDEAARRVAEIILKTSGGGSGGATLIPGVLRAGAPAKPLTTIRLRVARVAQILGIEPPIPAPEIARILAAHQIAAPAHVLPDGTFHCTIPAHRPDLEREIDLIEEVARTGGGGGGLAAIPIHDKVAVRPAPPQPSERAMHELGAALTSLGFYETVTFTFISPAEAKPFLPEGMATLQVSKDRRTHDPVLRPSVIPSLLKCRKANQDGGVGAAAEGGIRLFEAASVFGTGGGAGADERRILALLADILPAPGGSTKSSDQLQSTFRLLRAAIESITLALGGPGERARIALRAATPPFTAPERGAAAEVRLGAAGARIGVIYQVSRSVQSQHGLESPVCAAELDLAALLALYPPRATASALPAFPSIERDLSLILPEATPWADVERFVHQQSPALMESLRFVTTYRGKPIDAGKKSVTLRLRFRDPARTLRHEEVDPQMNQLIAAAKSTLSAEVRTT